MKAHVVVNAISVDIEHILDGEIVIETTCYDFDHYRSLPAVVVYKGIECKKTGWSSDRNIACYKQSTYIAHKRS